MREAGKDNERVETLTASRRSKQMASMWPSGWRNIWQRRRRDQISNLNSTERRKLEASRQPWPAAAFRYHSQCPCQVPKYNGPYFLQRRHLNRSGEGGGQETIG